MLNSFIYPKTIALIGATDRKNSVGLAMAQNLLKSKAKVFFVNLNRKKVFGKKAYANVSDIKQEIDLAIIAVPANAVPLVAENCVSKKVKAIIVVSAGFSEAGDLGKDLEQRVVSIFKDKVRFLGPNCMGLINTQNGLNATFGNLMPRKGGLAFLSQSGALINAVIGAGLNKKGSGFSLMVSLGNSADLDVCDFLEFLKDDPNTKAIALYLENIKHGKRFIEIAKAVSYQKPIVILKGGKTEKGIKTALSHTGGLSTEKEIYSAAFKKAGICEVETLTELFETALALSYWPKGFSGKIGIITNGGALGVLGADYCEQLSVEVAFVSDIVGTATHKDYEKAVREALSKNEIGAVLVAQTQQAMTCPIKNAGVIKKIKKEFPTKPIVACFAGSNEGADFLQVAGIPCVAEIWLACLLIKVLKQRYSLIQ